jgi:DNA-binding NarL/FixJ family response regulator
LEEPLSEREREVLGLLAAGRTNKEIAGELFVAEGTVKAHVAGVYRKLGVHSRAEAVSKAGDQKLL